MTGKDAGKGSFLAALAQAGFLIGLERNRFFFFLISVCYKHINTLKFLSAGKHKAYESYLGVRIIRPLWWLACLKKTYMNHDILFITT